MTATVVLVLVLCRLLIPLTATVVLAASAECARGIDSGAAELLALSLSAGDNSEAIQARSDALVTGFVILVAVNQYVDFLAAVNLLAELHLIE